MGLGSSVLQVGGKGEAGSIDKEPAQAFVPMESCHPVERGGSHRRRRTFGVWIE